MKVCHSCLKPGPKDYCKPCRDKLFEGKKISSTLPFTRLEYNELHYSHGENLSISGVQTKHSLKLDDHHLELTESGGTCILKPVPRGDLKNPDQAPANEHITMQIASQVFKIKTAHNCIVKFADGESAYLTRRFDVLPNGDKISQEDFAQIANISEETSGKNYKYDFSYEEIAKLIQKYVSASIVELEKFHIIILYNYLMSNGDAHIKNFSLFQDQQYQDYRMTPAYDLLNTGIHVKDETDTALSLFKDDYMTEAYKFNSKYTYDDFYEFGIKIGLFEPRIKNFIEQISSKKKEVAELIEKSFLSNNVKEQYITSINEKRKRIEYSYRKDKK